MVATPSFSTRRRATTTSRPRMCHHCPSDPRVVFGLLFNHLRCCRGLTQENVVDLLDALEGRWLGKDMSWVSRIESGKVAKLDRETVEVLAHVLDCDETERDALMLAAGFTPHLVSGASTMDDLWAHHARIAAALGATFKDMRGTGAVPDSP